MRHEKDITITADNRDKGKIFALKEMPTDQSERWAVKAILALTKSGVEVPEEIALNPSLAGIAYLGIKAFGGMEAPVVIQLLDEMFGCIQIRTNPQDPMFKRPLIEGDAGDIEEVATRLQLRMEVFSLHVGFSIADAIAAQRKDLLERQAAAKASQATKTSRRRSR